MKRHIQLFFLLATLRSEEYLITADEDPEAKCEASEIYSPPSQKKNYPLNKKGDKCKYIGGPMQYNQILKRREFLCDVAPADDTKWAFGIKKQKPWRVVLINMATGEEQVVFDKVPNKNSFLIQQGDGNLILREKQDGAALWKSGTSGNFGARLSLLCTGSLQITSYDESNKLWTLQRKGCRQKHWMSDKEWFDWDEYLCWDDKMFGIDEDGNIGYWKGEKKQWPDDDFKVWYMVMQSDGNLVARDKDEDALWASGTTSEVMGRDMRVAALILDDTGPYIKSTDGENVYWSDWKEVPTRRNLRS